MTNAGQRKILFLGRRACTYSPLAPQSYVLLQAGRPKKRFLFGHLFFNITNVFCAKKWVGHIQACPTRFWRKRRLFVLKKRWPKKQPFFAKRACTSLQHSHPLARNLAALINQSSLLARYLIKQRCLEQGLHGLELVVLIDSAARGDRLAGI